jgi:hypothetical protein
MSLLAAAAAQGQCHGDNVKNSKDNGNNGNNGMHSDGGKLGHGGNSGNGSNGRDGNGGDKDGGDGGVSSGGGGNGDNDSLPPQLPPLSLPMQLLVLACFVSLCLLLFLVDPSSGMINVTKC